MYFDAYERKMKLGDMFHITYVETTGVKHSFSRILKKYSKTSESAISGDCTDASACTDSTARAQKGLYEIGTVG